MIHIQNLSACTSVWKKEILRDVSLKFELGKNYCLLGKNGSGKSTLSSVLMGSPEYVVTGGSVTLYNPSKPSFNTKGRGQTDSSNLSSENTDVLSLSPEERSKAGIFLSFQNVPEIAGIKLSEYLRTIYNLSKISPQSDNTPIPLAGTIEQTSPQSSPAGEGVKGEFKWLTPFLFKRFIKKYLEELGIDPEFLNRDLNVWFSGWEKRKIEILQMKLIGPSYIILDEIDSGLDLDAFKKVAELLQSINSEKNSVIIITHYFTILEYVEVDEVYVLADGRVVEHWGKEVIDRVKSEGYS